MSDKTPEELAAEAGERGTFNFRERLLGRSYAKDDVVINLDEEVGYLVTKLESALEETDEEDEDRQKLLKDKIAAARKELAKTQYVVHMEGFSNDRHDELLKLAKEKFPVQYEKVDNPYTGIKTTVAKPSPDRDELFNRLLWRESIKCVIDSDGNVDENIDDEFIDMLLKNAPAAVLQRIANTIEKLRVASDWIEGTQDEDFLAKP